MTLPGGTKIHGAVLVAVGGYYLYQDYTIKASTTEYVMDAAVTLIGLSLFF